MSYLAELNITQQILKIPRCIQSPCDGNKRQKSEVADRVFHSRFASFGLFDGGYMCALPYSVGRNCLVNQITCKAILFSTLPYLTITSFSSTFTPLLVPGLRIRSLRRSLNSCVPLFSAHLRLSLINTKISE